MAENSIQIVLLGAPGAGKGTQAKVIAEKLGILHLSTGDVLRRNRAEGTELGKQAQGFMDSGKLVPDDLINRMVEAEIDSPIGAKGVVFDGYPRTLNQAESLDALLESKGRPVSVVINLDIDQEVVVARLGGRRVCNACGAVYHLTNLPPKVEGVCDTCGGQIYLRPDDNEATIRTRMGVYAEQTEPVLHYYRDRHTVHSVDAGAGITPTFDHIVTILDSMA